MSSLSSRGRDLLTALQKQAAGVPVAYTRAAGGTLTVTAVPGLTAARSADLPGRVEVSERDYLIAVADLMADGAERPPQLGDRIADTLNGTACVFEVQNPDTGEPAVRYASAWRAMYRVHTKRVA